MQEAIRDAPAHGPNAAPAPRGAAEPPYQPHPPDRPMRLWYAACQLLVRTAFVLLFRGRVFGRRNVPAGGGALLVANHQSYFDPVVVAMAVDRETSPMARDSLFRHRRFARVIRACNAFPVKRGSADLGAIREAITRLRAGHLVVVFPEGTRTRDGSIGPMHAGVILMARKAGVPIVPVMLNGFYQVLPRTSRFPRLHPVVVAIGSPVSAEQIKGMPDEQCVTLVRDRLIALMHRHRV